MESSLAPTLTVTRWRTATIVASALAALELAALVAIGVAVAGRSVAHHVRDAAIRRVAGIPAQPKQSPVGTPKLTRGETDVLVLNGGGVTGAAASSAERVRKLGYLLGGVGNTKHQSSTMRTLVMYRHGYRAEAARLATDVHARIVSPLDGMHPRDLMGAQLVLVIGR